MLRGGAWGSDAITMIVADQHNEWAVGRRYFRLESMAALAPKTEPIGELEEVA